MRKKIRICFFSMDAYCILAEKDSGNLGGAELQQVLLARELVKKGYDVSFIVADDGKSDTYEIKDGIKIYKLKTIHLFGLKALSSIINLWKTIWLIKPDILYQRCAGEITGLIGIICVINRIKFVYSVASKSDVDGTIYHNSYLVNQSSLAVFLQKKLYVIGLHLAKEIIVQSIEQQILLKNNYGKDSHFIKNIYYAVDTGHVKDTNPIVLWVSRIQEIKQPELFINLAKEIPNVRFKMIGGLSVNSDYFEKTKNDAEAVPNLDFLGFIPYHKIGKYFDEASIFVNTSDIEGFPNTFLQAWGSCTPVVSLNVDPDEIICKYNLGFHSKMFNQMIFDINFLLQNEFLRKEMGNNGKKYIEMFHGIDENVQKYDKLFRKLVE